MKQNFLKFALAASVLITTVGCSKLDDSLGSGQSTPGSGQGTPGSGSGTTNVAPLLKATYNDLRDPFQDQTGMWCLQEMSGDDAVGPTRGGDWDDNGIWRVLHSHQWNADHGFITSNYNRLGKIIFDATDLLRFSPTPVQAAQARFLRAFSTYSMLDGWDQCPYREPNGAALDNPKVRKGKEALEYIISELNAVIGDLPAATNPAYFVNKNAVRVLLIKCYLNKAVYLNRTAPVHAAADMNQVITLADQIISSNGYTLTPNFFNNFAPNNSSLSSENIFTAENVGGSESGNVRSRWFSTLHYNTNPSGWNGFTTLSDFYNKFDATDSRRGQEFPGVTDVSRLRVGFLVGQQFGYLKKNAPNASQDSTDGSGNRIIIPLKDRKGNPLAFTPAVQLKETGANLEVTGIRVIKYPIDYTSGDNVNNDYVYYRYADVLLMKAEAILRGGTPTAVAPTTADAAVNMVRARAALTPMTGVTLDQLGDERGKEFYWEGMRRTDMIRFGKFLGARILKPGISDNKYLLFPIPNQQLAVNPNLVQNPGY